MKRNQTKVEARGGVTITAYENESEKSGSGFADEVRCVIADFRWIHEESLQALPTISVEK